jgi:hypothetical protein
MKKNKKIAVCMYGQPRTWKYCLPYILKFYDIPNVEVDYFVSVKSYQMTGEYKDSSVTEITQCEISDIIQSYSPKKYSVINYSDEYSHADDHRNIYHTIVDSIMLKQQHEYETPEFYDFVFLQRFDAIVHPVNLLEQFFNSEWSNIHKNNCTLYYLSDNETPTSIFSPKGINDIWVGGSNVVMDMLGVDLINYIGYASGTDKTANSNKTIVPMFSDPHDLFYRLCLKNTINLELWNNAVNNVNIKSSIIRLSSDLSLDVFDPTSIDRHYQQYLDVNYNRKLKEFNA